MRILVIASVLVAGLSSLAAPLFAQEVSLDSPFYTSDELDYGVYLTTDAAGERTYLEIWYDSLEEQAICVPQGATTRCEQIFGSGFTLRRVSDAIVLESFSESERFERVRGRYLSRTGPVSYRELITDGNAAGGLSLFIEEWSLAERIELEIDAPDRFRLEEADTTISIRVDGDELRYLIRENTAVLEELVFSVTDGRGEAIAAFLPEPATLPNLQVRTRIVPTSEPPRVVATRELSLPSGFLPIGISPRAERLILVSQSGAYVLFDLATEEVSELPVAGRIEPGRIAWSPDERFITFLTGQAFMEDGDLPVLDLDRGRVREIAADDYKGSSWDLPAGVFDERASAWVDDRRLIFERVGPDAGTGVWLAEVASPDDWMNGAVEFREIIPAPNRGNYGLWHLDRRSGTLVLRSSRPMSSTGLRHPFLRFPSGASEALAAPEGDAELNRAPTSRLGYIPGRDALVVIPPSAMVDDEFGPPIPPAVLDLETGDLHSLLPEGSADRLRDVAAAPDGSAVALVHDDARSGRLNVSVRELEGSRAAGPLTTLYQSDGPSAYPPWRPRSGGARLISWAPDGRILVLTSVEGNMVELELARR